MKTIFAAFAFAIAFPAAAYAQAAPAPAPAKHCCCKDKSKPMDCCAEHGGREPDHDGHADHETSPKPSPQH